MRFREKVALVCLAVIALQISCIFSIPPIWTKKDTSKIFKKNNIKTDGKQFNSESLQSLKRKQPSTLKSFNFPEVEYSPVVLANSIRPKTILEETPHVKAVDHSEFLNKFRKDKRNKRKYASLKMPHETSIDRINNNYLSQIETFPQMEFPLFASETWGPSSRNQPSFPLHDPYFDFDETFDKPQKTQISNSMKKGKYASITNTKSKANNKIDLTPKSNKTVPMSKMIDVKVLQTNDKNFAKMIMPNSTTEFKLENNNKPEETSENVYKTSKPKRKPKTRKIKIVTKSSNVLRDLIAKNSNTSTYYNASGSDCSPRIQNETFNHAISDIINDRKNTEISDLLSDDFDVCFLNQNHEKTTNDDSQICVSFDHDTSIEELLLVSDTVNLTKKYSDSLFDELLNHTSKIDKIIQNNYDVAEPENTSQIFEEIVFRHRPELETQEEIITEIQETIPPLENVNNEGIFATVHNASNGYPTKILPDLHNDEFRIDKPTTTNSGRLENYELVDEETETKETDSDIVLSDLEHAIVNSKVDGTFDLLIPKIKQAILEAIVESAAFVPSHIATGFSSSKPNVYYDTNIIKDVEFINRDTEHIDSPDVISFMRNKYSVPNQTTDLNAIETSNLTEIETKNLKNTSSDDIVLEYKIEPSDTLRTSTMNSSTSNQNKRGVTKNKVVENENLQNFLTSDVILKQKEEEDNKETAHDSKTTTDSFDDTFDPLAREQMEELQNKSNKTETKSNTNFIYTNNKASQVTNNEDLSTNITTIESDDIELEYKTKPSDILRTPFSNSSTSNQDKTIVTKNKVVEKENLLNYPMSDVIIKQKEEEENKETAYDLNIITDSFNVDPLANEQTEELQNKSNITKIETDDINEIFSDGIKLEYKTEPSDTPRTPPSNSSTLNQDKEVVTKGNVVMNENSLKYPTYDVILKQKEEENKETAYDFTIITYSFDDSTNSLGNEQLEELQNKSNKTETESNTNSIYTNNKVSQVTNNEDLSTTVSSIKTSNNKMNSVNILVESANDDDNNYNDNINITTTKNIDLLSNEKSADKLTVFDLDTNSKTKKTHENNSDVNDSINGYKSSNQDNNDNDLKMMKIADELNNYKLVDINDDGSLPNAVNGLTQKQGDITSSRTSSDTIESYFSSPYTAYYNDSQQYLSENTYELKEQTSPNENDIKEINIYIDHSGWKRKYGEENSFQSLLNPDLEIRILYADETETDSEPQPQLKDALEIEDNVYIGHSFKDNITVSHFLESNITTPDIKFILETKTSTESLSHEVKPDISLKDPSLNDDFSSDEFTEEILNAMLDILCIEEDECNDETTVNNTLHDILMLAEYEPIDTNDETKNNADGKIILNEDKGVESYSKDKYITTNDTCVLLVPDSIDDFEDVDNASDENRNAEKSKQGPFQGETLVYNENPPDFHDNGNTDEVHDMTSDIKTINEQEHNIQENIKDTKKPYPKLSSSIESTAAIDVTNLDLQNTCTDEVANNEDLTTPERNYSSLEVSSIEKALTDNTEPDNRVTESIGGTFDEEKPLNIETPAENNQDTATHEILPDAGDEKVR